MENAQKNSVYNEGFNLSYNTSIYWEPTMPKTLYWDNFFHLRNLHLAEGSDKLLMIMQIKH